LKITSRIADDPTNWTSEDWTGRDDALRSINDLARRTIAHPSTYGPNIWEKFPMWAAGAKDHNDFLGRMKFGLLNVTKMETHRVASAARTNRTMSALKTDAFRQSVYNYLESKVSSFPIVQMRIHFCDWLKQNGITDAGIEEYRKELEDEIVGVTAKPNVAGEYNVYQSDKLIGSMELFADGSVRNWKGQKKPEYRWSVEGDLLVLKWVSTQDSFKLPVDGKLVGASADTKNMFIEKKK
jgi:hypothetical protein